MVYGEMKKTQMHHFSIHLNFSISVHLRLYYFIFLVLVSSSNVSCSHCSAMCDHRFKVFASLERRMQSCSFQLISKFPSTKTFVARILGGRSDSRVEALDKWLRELISMHGRTLTIFFSLLYSTRKNARKKNFKLYGIVLWRWPLLLSSSLKNTLIKPSR